MAGEYVPLVMIPRFTTLAGTPTGGFATIGLDVTAYANATLNTYMGPLMGTTGTTKIFFEESTDQTSWKVCSGGDVAGDNLTENDETSRTVALARRWFRVRIVHPNADNLATYWSMGFLERRES